MDKRSLKDAFYSSVAVHRSATFAITAGSSVLGSRVLEGMAPVVRGDITATGMIAGGIAGFLVCASAFKL